MKYLAYVLNQFLECGIHSESFSDRNILYHMAAEIEAKIKQVPKHSLVKIDLHAIKNTCEKGEIELCIFSQSEEGDNYLKECLQSIDKMLRELKITIPC